MSKILSLPLGIALAGLSACSQADSRAVEHVAVSTGGTARCEHNAPRQLDLDLAGARSVHFQTGRHTLRVEAAADGKGRLAGRACASSADLLDGLRLAQERRGDTLVVTLEQDNQANVFFNLGKSRYAWMDLAVTLPPGLPVQLSVASGDALARNLPSLKASVASGDLRAERIAGPVQLELASGDAHLAGVGAVSARIASGDLELRGASGPVDLSVASGDANLRDTGPVTVTALASGDVEIDGVEGDLLVRSVSSGGLEARGVRGRVDIESIGSGKVDLRDIAGDIAIGSVASGNVEVGQARGSLRVRHVGSGSVRHRDVAGPVVLPRSR